MTEWWFIIHIIFKASTQEYVSLQRRSGPLGEEGDGAGCVCVGGGGRHTVFTHTHTHTHTPPSSPLGWRIGGFGPWGPGMARLLHDGTVCAIFRPARKEHAVGFGQSRAISVCLAPICSLTVRALRCPCTSCCTCAFVSSQLAGNGAKWCSA